ncbi:MAG: arsenate reductase ArsC [Phenylobacterium sp.]|uniref:arsenate reductase ArsC n=1 Tax=Phenylobacterium sp. TaxID=1871053 RepID=UPI0027336FFD|nr:arsenate reductase ArsC [Phenylobacterium sp.]MDP3173134.1 arsenate reductase ArsC [Phenylobacterium sp.]
MSAFNILFLCTGNSARSILAEAITNALPGAKFTGYSAGSMPRGEVNPHALALLNKLGHPTSGLRSKSWDEFAVPGATPLHFVITVCDNAAGEVCPIWPGQPMTAHWGLPDPADVAGTDAEIAVAFADTYRMLRNRIGAFAELPLASLDRLSLKRRMDEIGKDVVETANDTAAR